MSRTIEVVHSGASAGEVFRASTHNGRLTITGEPSDVCRLTATIEVRAASDSEAAMLVEQVDVRLERSEDGVQVVVEKPDLGWRQSVTVNLHATIPAGMTAELEAHNGRIRVNGVASAVGRTHNGGIEAVDLEGGADLQSHNGAIRCDNVPGPLRLNTHNGGVTARLPLAVETDCVIRTRNGQIDLEVAAAFSGRVSARTRNGGIHSDVQVIVNGSVSKQSLEGVVGSGQGLLDLETRNGSIFIRTDEES